MPEAELQQNAIAAFQAATSPAAEAHEAAEASPAVDPIEARALELGWNPDYAGDGAKSAAEWVLQRLDRATASNQKLRTRMSQVVNDAARIQRQTLENAERQLKAQRAQAIEDGNAPAVDALDDQLQRVRTQKADADPKPDLTPVIEWERTNAAWFNEGSPQYDPERAEDVEGWFHAYLKRNPGDFEGVVEHLDAKLRKHYSETPAHKAPQQPARVEGRRSVTGGGKPVKGFADLPDEAKQAAITFEKRGGPTRHEYAKTYWSANA